MDFMVMDISCFDGMQAGLDATTSIVGTEFEDSYADASSSSATEATLIIMGRCMDSKSVCITAIGYQPWVRLCVPQGHSCNSIKAMAQSFRINVIRVDLEMLPKFYGYSEKMACYKVYVKTFADARNLTYRCKDRFEVTDSATPDSVKAFNDLGLEPSGWCSIAEPGPLNALRISTCAVEYTAHVSKLVPIPITAVAPIKIFSFDAEMYSHDNGFPEVINGDFTMAVCATIKTYGSSVLERHALVLYDGTLKPTTSIEMHYYKTTEDLLDGFRDLVALSDPDILTGWNIYGFDMPFMWDQYQAAYTPRSQRGSEALHVALMEMLGRPTKTTADLLKTSKLSTDSLAMRWRLVLRSPKELPEVVASKLRASLGLKEKPLDMDDFNTLVKLTANTIVGPSGPITDSSKFKALNCARFKATMLQGRMEGPKRFEFLGRLAFTRSTLTEKRMASSAKGDNCYYYWSGRTCVDLMQIIKDDKKLENNTLKFAAQTFLDPEFGKIDLSPAEIFKAWRTKDPQKLADMIDYCARDADIPILLIDKLSYVPIWIEMSRVTFTSLQQVLNGGQQRRVYNTIAHFVHNKYALNKADCGWPVTDVDIDEEDFKKRKSDYQGATVIEPISGYYKEAVSTLDFESLYPSIIIHFNLCPSVYVGHDLANPGPNTETHCIKHSILQSDGKYLDFDRFYTFQKDAPGVVPSLLQHLLKARKVAKRAMAAATNEFEKSVQNGRQLALKVSCNSVYGFFGVAPKRGLMSCKPVAAVTTLKGRAFIEASKTYVEATYEGSSVLYGDTDSIMIKWGPGISIPKAYSLAEEASAAITELLRSGRIKEASRPLLETASAAVTLANEKVYCPYLLIQKKNYAGLKYTAKCSKPLTLEDFESCIDMKGIDAVRRDRSKLIKTLSEAVLDALLIKMDLNKALEVLKSTIASVAQQKAPLDWFVLSKSLKSSYASENQPHVQAWKRMALRGDPDVPEVGTRMPYVIVAPKPGAKNGPLYERTEHPDFVARSNIQVDAKYYLENAKDVLERLLGPTGASVSKLFDDAIADSEAKNAGNMTLMSFFKKARVCP
jgi:DNA polymerase elongation subunit (family B)